MKIELIKFSKNQINSYHYDCEFNVTTSFPTWKEVVHWLYPSGMPFKNIYAPVEGTSLLECLEEYWVIKCSSPSTGEDLNLIYNRLVEYKEHKRAKEIKEKQRQAMRKEISEIGDSFTIKNNGEYAQVLVGETEYKIWFSYPEFMDEDVRIINCSCPSGDAGCRHIHAYEQSNMENTPIGYTKTFEGLI